MVEEDEKTVMSEFVGDKKVISEQGKENLSHDNRNLLICILTSLFCIQTLNMNVSTIVPNYVKLKHPSLSEFYVSLIMT